VIISICFREATFQGRQHFREYIVLETCFLVKEEKRDKFPFHIANS
jgi:hypothetical protein